MMEAGVQNGLVVTPSGKVYERESGILLGDRLSITTEPPTFDNRYQMRPEGASVRGDMVMPNGENWGFQTYASKIEYIGRETYTPQSQSSRDTQWRDAMFASRYGGNANDWVNAAGITFRGNGE
jgi:hypothetical protein